MEFKLTRKYPAFLFIISSDDNKKAQQVYFNTTSQWQSLENPDIFLDIESINYKGIIILFISCNCPVPLHEKCKFQKLHYNFHCSSEAFLTLEILSIETKQGKHAVCNEKQWNARV